MRLSCPEQMLGDRPFSERLDLIARSGFEGVDCRFASLGDSGFRAARARSGLPLATVFSQVQTPSLLDARAADRARAVADVRERAKRAAEAGASSLILVPIFGPPRIDLPVSTDRIEAIESALLVVGLKEITHDVRDLPITIVLEPLNLGETHLLVNPSVAAVLCDEIGSPRIATMVDTYHCSREGICSAEQIRAVRRHLGLIHIADSNRGLPGEGDVPFAEVMRALDATGYDGWLGYETRQIATAEDDRALARSVQVLRGLIDSARADRMQEGQHK